MEILKNRLNVAVAALACVFSCPVAFAKTPAHYQQHNLVSSDASISADHIDHNLVNPWGLVFGPTNPVWIANNGTGTSTLYDGMGNAIPLIVNIPSSGGGTGTPTGIVFNNTSGWVISSGGKSASAIFIFATEDGTISAWTPSVNPNNAIIAVNDPSKGAIYKGLAIGSDGTRSLLYASNFNSGNVDVFDSNFAPTTVPGGFVDTHLPKGYAPFGIHNIQGNIYVTYAKQDATKHDDVPGPGFGYVNVFDPNGNLIKRVASQGPLNAPWAVALAPSDFGIHSRQLLIGNFGDGKINAYTYGGFTFQKSLDTPAGDPLVIDGLWAIGFGNGLRNQSINTLFFTAGPADESKGLYGSLTAVP